MLDIEQKRIVGVAVLCPHFGTQKNQASTENRLAEALLLAQAIKLDVRYAQKISLREIKPATYFSRGFLGTLVPLFKEQNIELLIVDAQLSPLQQRHLEEELLIKVIDRTALILEIFGERAQTAEGKLQVALAHLTYQRSRLVRSWTHLERQRGGAGFLGGPGEKQIELDRRLIDEKIIKIKKDLQKVKNTRTLQRANRERVPYPVVALVGYTNAGKSTLFNKLTGADVFVQDMLFATLDPSLRKFNLPSGKEVIFSDTVGFISDLPHELIMAFRSTLEEVLEADIIVHVRDCASLETNTQRQNVLSVLQDLGLENIETSAQYIEVFNKMDLLSPQDQNFFEQQVRKNPERCLCLSALQGTHCIRLLQLIEKKLTLDACAYRILFSAGNGKLRAWLYENAEILKEKNQDDQIIVELKMKAVQHARFLKLFAGAFKEEFIERLCS